MEYFFHVTPAKNVSNIEKCGVMAEYSQGARDVSWWVDRRRIEWAIMHVCQKYHLPPQEVWVCVAEFSSDGVLRRAPMVGLYYCNLAEVMITAACPASTLLDNENAFDDWYAQAAIPF